MSDCACSISCAQEVAELHDDHDDFNKVPPSTAVATTPIASPLGRQISASMAGTAVSVVTLNPIVVMKVMMQRKDALAEISVAGAFRTVLRTGGMSGFWAGTSTGLLQAVPNSVLYMTAYEHLKADFAVRGVVNGTLAPGLAGAMARFYAVSIIAPLELIRTLHTAGHHGSAWDLAQNVVRRDGVQGLYRGWYSTVLRDVPFSAVYWVTFERLKSVYRGLFGLDIVLVAHTDGMGGGAPGGGAAPGLAASVTPAVAPAASAGCSSSSDGGGGGGGGGGHTGPKQYLCTQPPLVKSICWPICQLSVNPNTLTFISGATSGVLAAIITHPFDVLKTQQQLSRAAAVGSSTSRIIPWSSVTAMATTGAGVGAGADAGAGASSPALVPWLRRAAHTLLRGALTAPPSSLAGPPLWLTLQELHRSQGIRGLYRGLSMRLLTVIPSSAIMVTVYEYLKNV